MINIEENYNKFLGLVEKYVKRDGVEKLIAWLNSKDVKNAPNSAKYNLACKGGLVQHALNTLNRLIKLMKSEYGDNLPYSFETMTIVSLLLVVPKADFYETATRNVKVDGQWVQETYYKVKEIDNRLLFGSMSMNTYYMVSKFIKLTYDEELALLYHNGGLDSTDDQIKTSNVIAAFKKCPLALLLHQAEMQALIFDDKE